MRDEGRRERWGLSQRKRGGECRRVEGEEGEVLGYEKGEEPRGEEERVVLEGERSNVKVRRYFAEFERSRQRSSGGSLVEVQVNEERFSKRSRKRDKPCSSSCGASGLTGGTTLRCCTRSGSIEVTRHVPFFSPSPCSIDSRIESSSGSVM